MIDFSGARKGAKILKNASTEIKNKALLNIASALECSVDEILKANLADIEKAEKNGIKPSMVDRLRLTKDRILSIASDVKKVATLPDPVGEVVEKFTTETGLNIKKVRVPFGVIGAIYESRPNVTVDISVLCIKTGNACVLKGGKEAEQTNKILVEIIKTAVKPYFDEGVVTLLASDRALIQELITARGEVDLVFPRGGKGLIDFVVNNATVPVIETGAGVCHVFVEKSCDVEIARKVVLNAKISRPSVCNSAETLLIDEAIAPSVLPLLEADLVGAGVTLHADEKTAKLLKNAVIMGENDYATEYNSMDMSVKIVSGVEEAIEHINFFGTHHSDAIITTDKAIADKFTSEIDSACCYVNCSTRFTDGGCFGFGAELGISTQKMHARGPMGLKEMTSYHYVVEGNGNVR